MFWQRGSVGLVDWGFTDRQGGASRPPYDSLNLAIGGLDDPHAVAENHRRVGEAFAPDCPLLDMDQVHGAVVAVVDPDTTPDAGRPRCDALVTNRSDVVLLVRVADCVPVLLADPRAGLVAVAHAGRPGVAAGVLPATVATMTAQGADPDAMTAWIGPHVCGDCYEVPEALQREVTDLEPATRATTSWGTPALDLGAGASAQLERSGVRAVATGGCTREESRLFSYRRDGRAAGRLAGMIRRHPGGAEPVSGG